MKRQKNILLHGPVSFTLLLSMLFAVSCGSKSKTEPDSNEYYIEIEGGEELSYEQKQRYITVSANGDWTLTRDFGSQEEWFTLSKYEGTGIKKDLLLSPRIYNGPPTQPDRTGTIILNSEEGTRTLKIIQHPANYVPTDISKLLAKLEVPYVPDTKYPWVLDYDKGDFIVLYSKDDKDPNWSAWPLTKSHIVKNTDRTNAWQYDNRIPAGYLPNYNQGDYSGYQRGHLCPSADRTASKAMNAETFYYSNMIPQNGSLNMGCWGSIEDDTRGWLVNATDSIFICAGMHVSQHADSIIGHSSPSNMTIPKYVFKVILKRTGDNSNTTWTSIGFWFENAAPGMAHRDKGFGAKFACSVRDIESKTGIDFFPNLKNRVGESEYDRIEGMSYGSQADMNKWPPIAY